MDAVLSSRDLILPNLNERMNNLIEALFSFWANKKPSINADLFYQKMTTFGLAPDLKFIENIMTIIYSNRPKPIAKS